MSQVRKLQSGGKPTYGHIIIDGIDYGNSEETYRQFSEHAKLQDPRQGEAYAKWLSDLRNGQDVVLDVDNTVNSHPDSMSDERAGKRGFFRKVIDDVANTPRNAFSEAIYTARQFSPIKAPVKKTKHSNDSVAFVFNGENNRYDENAMANIGIKDRINSYLDWLSNDSWENENEFTSKLSDQQKANLRAWYNSLNGATPEEKRNVALSIWNANLDKVRQAEGGYENVDASARDFFNNFNIGNIAAAATSDSAESKEENEIRKKLRDSGYNEDLYKLIGNNFELGDDGVWRAKAGSFDFGLGTGNIYFNDDFYNSVYGADGRYNPLKGLTYYNGGLYKNDNAALAQILNASGGYNDLVKNGDFIGADQIIRTRFTPEEMDNPGVLSEDSYSSFINPGMQFSNLTGLYTLNDGSMQDGQQLIQYIDLNSPVQDGPYAKYNYKFALLDSHGNKVRDDITREDLSKIVGGTSAGNLLTYKKVTKRGSGKYANKYYEDITGNNGEYSGIRIYRDINKPDSDVILHLDNMPGFANGKDVVLPPEVAKILMSDQSWINKIAGNAKARENFVNMLHSLGEGIGSKTFDNWWEIMIPGMAFARDKQNDVDYRLSKLRTFMSESQINALQQALINASKGSKWDRRSSYFVDSPTEFRNGGKMQYVAKLAGGGFAGGNKKSEGITEKRVSTNVVNTKNASSLSEIGSNTWTNADTNDLLALGADLASLGLAFVPGANVASTATGVASSLARFEADRQRGTSGAGAQLGVNLAMDAATLLPFIGGAAKSGKVVKAVKSALPVIIKAASVYGLSSAVVTSAKKIANGEKFTVRDVSNVVNGITAGIGVARSGGLGKGNKKVKGFEDIKLQSKDGSKTLTLSGKEVENIDSPEKLFDALVAKSKLSKEQFSEQFDVSSLLTSTSKWTPGWKPKDWGNKNTEKIFKPKKTTTRETVQANGNKWHDWWYGVGESQQAYRAALANDAKRASLRKTVGGAKSSRMVWDGKSWVPVSTRQVPVNDGGWALSSVPTSAGGPNPNNLPAVIQDVVVPVPTRQMQTRVTLNPKMSKRVITRGNGVRFDRNFYNLARRQSVVHPQIFIIRPGTDNQYEEPYGMVRNPFYKKGGVIKAQNGWRFNYYRRDLPWSLMDDTVVDYNPFSTTPPAEFKGSTPEAYYAGAKDAITEAYGRAYDPNAVGYDLSHYNQPVNEQPVNEEPIKLSSVAQTDVQSSNTGNSKYGDNNIDTSKALSSLYSTALGAAEYGAKATYRRKVRDDMAKGIRESYYSTPSVHLDMYSTANPVADAQISYLKQQNSVDNLPKTADYTAYLAGLLTKQDNINRALETATRSASAEYANINRANTEIANKQHISDQEVLNSNLARAAGMRMQLAQNKASYDMQTGQSIANAIREVRAKTDSNIAKANQFAFNNAATALDDKYERSWNGKLGDYYSQWLALDSSIRDQYSDVNDWLQRAPENKGVWNQYDQAWQNHQDALNRERIRLYAKYNLSPGAEFIYRQRYGTLKKGGRIGRNRYKNEPEEDVWINQNKAVHKQVAKFNDNIIKIFLKTLK